MRKKLLASILTVCMLFTMLPTAAFAVEGEKGMVSIDTLVEAEDGTYDANSEHVTYTYDDTKKCEHSKQNSEGHYLEGELSWVKTVTFSGISFSELTDNSEDMTKLKSVIMNGRRTDISDEFKDSIEVTFENCSFNQKTATLQVYKIMPCNVTKYTFVNCTFDQKAAGQYTITLNASETGFNSRAISYEIIDSVINSAGRGINITAGTESESLGAYMPSIVIKGNNFTLPAASNSNMAIQIAGVWDSAKLTADSDPLLTVEQNKIKAYAAVRVSDNMSDNTTDSAKYMVRFADNVLAEGTKGAVTKASDTNETTNAIAAYYNARLMGPAAQIGETTYDTLSGAIGAAQAGETVTLLRNTSISKQINVNKNLTLNLGGKTLTNSGTGFAFVVNTDRTFILTNGMLKSDSGSGVAGVKGTNITIDRTATIDTKNYALFGTNNTDNEGHAIFNVYGTLRSDSIGIFIQGPCNTINIDGANITSNYFGVYQNGSYGGGTFTIKNSTIVDKSSTGVYISNSKGNADNTNQGYHTLNIQNSKITGDTGVEVKFTNVTISGENTEITATGTPVDLTLNNNGAVSTGYALAVTHNAKDADKDAAAGTITVENGKFSGVVGIQIPSEGKVTEARMTIKNGYFTTAPDTDYLADNKTLVKSDKDEYNWMIAAKAEHAAEIFPAVPEAESKLPENANSEDKALADRVVDALKNNNSGATPPSVDADVMNAEASNLANANTITVEQGEQMLKDESITVEKNDTVTIVVQPYLDIKITGANATGTTKTLTMDITPMYQKVATTADFENGEEITVKKDGVNSPNAVILATGELNITKPVTVTIPLPEGFTTGNTLYIKHITDNGRTYYYTGVVKNDILTFTNPHGFSSFTISAVNDAVAEVNGVGYPTLQAAVDAVENNGTIKLLKDGESATVGRTVKFTVEPADKNCTIHAGAYTTVEKNGNTYTCVYTAPSTGGGSYEPSGDYVVSVDKTVGGKVTVNPGRADKGDTVTITVRPDKGYELDSLTVTAKDGGTVKLTEKSNGKFTFKMPGSKVTVEAVFVKEETKPVVTLPFADVNKGDWFYDAVEYVYGHDLMNGTSSAAFSPYLTTSRAMMLTMLARYDGVDTTTGSTWYEAGAVWAVSKGISDGTNLEADLTREQLVTMLWRYTGSPVVESDLSAYPDGGSVSDWAVNAMIWATNEGVITGNGAGALNPQGTATRAEVATILARFCAMEG